MRNGNPVPDDPVINIHSSSYRTYEEWKLIFFRGVLVEFIQVLTVPMRNGNFDYVSYVDDCPVKFLPYLWGMETPLHLHRNNLLATFLPYLWGMETGLFFFLWEAHREVLTVPMRNGNGQFIRDYRKKYSVLTVPMRNGNVSGLAAIFVIRACSYRTYEEWKLRTSSFKSRISKCSYRTYEEWKLGIKYSLVSCWPQVLTVPMRNGNTIELSKFFQQAQFLPYLWGMETENRWKV